MSSPEPRSEAATEIPDGGRVDMRLEVVVLPVSDVDRAKQFYTNLGWRLDIDRATNDGLRVVHFTPPGSQCSILFGTGVTTAGPGSVQGLHLIVSDIETAHNELTARGIDASEVFHDARGGFNRFDDAVRASGPDPARRSYASYVSFSDPDGNGWLLQEVTTRLPGRVDPATTTFSSAGDLAKALERAAAAHSEHEKRTGRDPNWPAWYAAYMLAEQAGTELPQ